MTINAARALGLAHSIGSIAAGKQADLCAWRIESLSELGYWVGLPGPERRIFGGLNLRLAAALVALVCWVGLALNFSATYAHQGHVLATLWRLGHFFTIISNLALAIAMTMIALGGRVSPFVQSGLTLAILLVGIVYVALLHGLHSLSGPGLIANQLLHYVSPLAMAVYWLLFTPHGRLRWKDPICWAVFPSIYFVYVIARDLSGDGYPYPFIDLRSLGEVQTAINALGIAAGFVLCGFVLVAIDRHLLGRGRARR